MVLTYAWSIGFDILALEFSPIKGPEGNIEYLAWLQKTDRAWQHGGASRLGGGADSSSGGHRCRSRSWKRPMRLWIKTSRGRTRDESILCDYQQ